MHIQSCNALLLFLLTLAQGPRKTSGRGSHILKTVRRGTCTVSLLLDQSLWSLNWIVCSYLDFKSYISQVHASVHLGEYGCGRVPATGGTQLIPVQCHLSGTSKRRPWKRLERCRNGDEEQHWPRMCVVVEPSRTLKTVPETFRRENCLPSGGGAVTFSSWVSFNGRHPKSKRCRPPLGHLCAWPRHSWWTRSWRPNFWLS